MKTLTILQKHSKRFKFEFRDKAGCSLFINGHRPRIIAKSADNQIMIDKFLNVICPAEGTAELYLSVAESSELPEGKLTCQIALEVECPTSELILDPEFSEDLGDPWIFTGEDFTITKDEGILRLANNTAGTLTGANLIQQVSISGQKKYTASTKVRRQIGPGGLPVNMVVEYYDKDDNLIGQEEMEFTPSPNFETYEINSVTPEDTDYVKFYLFKDKSLNANRYIEVSEPNLSYLDKVSNRYSTKIDGNHRFELEVMPTLF